MKRALILAVGILSISAATAFAQSPTTPEAPATRTVGADFVDANGDGICDNFQAGTRQGQGNGMARRGKRLGPQDGSGYGAGSGAAVGRGNGTGVCDGTGPKGNGRGRGRR
jgi:hypothetical protein